MQVQSVKSLSNTEASAVGENKPFSPLIESIAARFNAHDYQEKTCQELRQKNCLSKISYHADHFPLKTKAYHTVMKILKIVVGIIIFPIGIYWIAHSWGTLKLMPVARPKIKAHIELNVRNLNDTFSSSAVHYNKIKRLAVAAGIAAGANGGNHAARLGAARQWQAEEGPALAEAAPLHPGPAGDKTADNDAGKKPAQREKHHTNDAGNEHKKQRQQHAQRVHGISRGMDLVAELG